MHKVLFLSYIFLHLMCVHSEVLNTSDCKSKGKCVTSLNMAKTSISKAKELLEHCRENTTISDTTSCGMKEIPLGYLDVAINLINDALEYYPTCNDKEIKEKTLKHEKPIDCSELLENGHTESGVYSIWLKKGTKSSPLKVFCDMETAGGGWTVIQRRGDFSYRRQRSENFNRRWSDYKKGFGNIEKEFWLGNDNIYALTNQGSYSIRFDLEDAAGVKGFAEYQFFRIDNEAFKYMLHIGNYSGNVGDSMYFHNGKKFSTYDDGNDESYYGDYCTKLYKGGWWYANCYKANLNGIYRKGARDDASTVNWYTWRYGCLNAVNMKLKRI